MSHLDFAIKFASSTALATPAPPVSPRRPCMDSKPKAILANRRIVSNGHTDDGLRYRARRQRGHQPRDAPPRPDQKSHLPTARRKPSVIRQPNKRLSEAKALSIAVAAANASRRHGHSSLPHSSQDREPARSSIVATAYGKVIESIHPLDDEIRASSDRDSNLTAKVETTRSSTGTNSNSKPSDDTTPQAKAEQDDKLGPLAGTHTTTALQEKQQLSRPQARWRIGLRRVVLGVTLTRFNKHVQKTAAVLRANVSWDKVRKICEAARSLENLNKVFRGSAPQSKLVAKREIQLLTKVPPLQRSTESLQRLSEFTKNVPSFHEMALSEEHHLDLCNVMQWRDFPLGLTTVFQEGQVADGMYIVVLGSALVQQLSLASGVTRVVARKDAGSCFGFTELQGTARKRTTTVVTSGKCSCLFVSAHDYTRIVGASYSSELDRRVAFLKHQLPLIILDPHDGTTKQALYPSSKRRLAIAHIRRRTRGTVARNKLSATLLEAGAGGWSGFGYDGRTDPRHELSCDDVEQLALVSEKHVFRGGDLLVEEGAPYDSSRFLIIVLTGRVEVQRCAELQHINKAEIADVSSNPQATSGSSSSSSNPKPKCHEHDLDHSTKNEHLRSILAANRKTFAQGQRSKRWATVRLCSLGPGELVCDPSRGRGEDRVGCGGRGSSTRMPTQASCIPLNRMSVVADGPAAVLFVAESDAMHTISCEGLEAIRAASLQIPRRAVVRELAVSYRQWQKFKQDTVSTICTKARLLSETQRKKLMQASERIKFTDRTEGMKTCSLGGCDDVESVESSSGGEGLASFAQMTLNANRRVNSPVASEGAMCFRVTRKQFRRNKRTSPSHAMNAKRDIDLKL
jgi:CRP-like cAMP-binding protein